MTVVDQIKNNIEAGNEKNIINKRYDFVVLFDVKNGNPNGDPDAGGMPRVDLETGNGLVTDTCFKRKIRNYVDMVMSGVPGYRIYIKNDSSLETKNYEAYEYLKINRKDVAKIKKERDGVDGEIRDFMCGNFYDTRAFGAVMTTFTTDKLNCGQIRGPIQIGFARSVDPVIIQEVCITRQALSTQKDIDEGKNNTMGKKFIVPYGLYRVEGHISANIADTTGFTEDDLKLFWDAVINMFEEDHSAMRGEMAVRELIVFEHESKHGNAPSYKLFDSVNVKKVSDGPARDYKDYEVKIEMENIPEQIKVYSGLKLG